MVGFDRRRLVIANVMGLLLSVPILVVGVLLASKRSEYCITFIEKPLISMGILLFLVSGAGLLAAWLRIHWLYLLHTISLLLLVILLLCFAIFAIDITSGGSGLPSPPNTTPGGSSSASARYKEYVLDDYPKWMRQKVERKREWKEVTLCLQRNGFCSLENLPYNGTNKFLYDQSNLSPIQSGCCKPPLACQFVYVDATHWITPSNPNANSDCQAWNNDQSLLCYQCSSCKAGVIQATKDRWIRAGTTLFIVVILLITFYMLLGFIAFQREPIH